MLLSKTRPLHLLAVLLALVSPLAILPPAHGDGPDSGNPQPSSADSIPSAAKLPVEPPGSREDNIQTRAAYRGPVNLVIDHDQRWMVTANELSNSLSLIDLQSQEVIDEIACDGKPADCVRLGSDEVLVSCRDAGLIRRYAIELDAQRPRSLKLVATIETGYEPLGIAIAPSRQRAYVGLVASGEVAELNLSDNTLERRLSVGHWPRYVAVSPDGSKLAVGLSGESQVAVLNLPSGELAYQEPLSSSINMGLMRCSTDGEYVYFPWMIYRSNPIDPGNIRRGWVLASRVARVRLDGPSIREAISLDVPGLAMSDPHGLTFTPDESQLAVTSSGTHEVLLYRTAKLDFIGTGGPGDLIDPRLARDAEAFTRIDVGGRPLGIEACSDNRTLWLCNHTLDCVQRIDLESRQVTARISLGQPASEPAQQLAHRGLEIFHDATYSLDQWYSCRSCHLDGGSNAKPMDTWNDGSELTAKSVLPLIGVTETGPWTWHGWQQDLDESIQNSFVSTMQGREASPSDVTAVRAYLANLQRPANPFRQGDQAHVEAVNLGEELFHSAEVGCSSCHSSVHFSDGLIHDVGLGSKDDRYDGYNTPSLVGVYQKVRLLHDGRARSLRDVLTRWHTPTEIGGGAELTEQQLEQLIAYLKTL